MPSPDCPYVMHGAMPDPPNTERPTAGEMMGCPFCGGHWHQEGSCPMCNDTGEIPTPLCWVPYTREEENLQAELLNGMSSPSNPYIEVARRMLATLRAERKENAAAESRGYVRAMTEARDKMQWAIEQLHEGTCNTCDGTGVGTRLAQAEAERDKAFRLGAEAMRRSILSSVSGITDDGDMSWSEACQYVEEIVEALPNPAPPSPPAGEEVPNA